MSEAEFERMFWAKAARFPRCVLAFGTAYFLLWLQGYLTVNQIWIAAMIAVLAMTDLGIPVARFALAILALMVLIPPEMSGQIATWLRAFA